MVAVEKSRLEKAEVERDEEQDDAEGGEGRRSRFDDNRKAAKGKEEVERGEAGERDKREETRGASTCRRNPELTRTNICKTN